MRKREKIFIYRERGIVVGKSELYVYIVGEREKKYIYIEREC